MDSLFHTVQADLRDSYRLDRELGRGGMATVYLAQDLRHDRPVALKVLHPQLADSVGGARFLREIRLAARLTHPNILPLFDSGEVAGTFYYVMPYVAGESLRARLAREGQLPVADTLRIIGTIAAALDYANAQGIVHRDVKPDNILLEAGEAVLADLGIARAVGAAAGETLTATGIGLGTPAYMSPEQVAGDAHVDGRSDQYSLACIAYEMLAGEQPFRGPSAQAVMARRIAEPPPRISRLRDGCPAQLDDALARGMARTPADRFATSGEFARALGAAAAPAPAASPLVGPGSAARRWKTPALAAAGVLLLVAGAAALLRRPDAAVSGPASVMAVVPFAPASDDTALVRLGRDLVVTISQTLDGIGGLRTVDAQTVLLHPASASGGVGSALRVARDRGAGSVLHGSLVRVGSRARADLMLVTTDSAATLARVSVMASPDSIGTFTDSIVRSVLRQIWRGGGAPSPSLDVAMRTRSLDALRAFLAGEQHVVRGEWDEGAAAYARAIEADSTFWLAYWRDAFALGWHGAAVDPAITAAVVAHSSELPLRERLMVRATIELADSVSGMIVTLRELTTSFPDYWFGWLVHADVLTHFGGLLGVPQADAMAAFERAVTLNPGLLPAWEHYAWLALLQRDTAAMTRALDGLRRFDARAAAADFGWDQITSLRLTDRILRGDSAGAAPFWRAHVADLAARANPSFGADALERHGLAQEQIRLTRQVLAASPPVAAVPAHRQALVHAFIRRGAWDSALAFFEQRGAGQLNDAAVRGYRLAVLAAWLGALPPSAAAAHRGRARESAGVNPLAVAELAWLDGVLALAREDTAGSAAAIVALAADSAANAALLHRSLTALRAGANGDVAGAARRLASLEWERAEHGYADAEPHPLVTVVDRLAAGRWLRETGELDEASRLLRWTEGAYTLYPGAAESVGAATIVEYELGRVAEAAGATDEAVRRYREFVRLYDLPPPAHRPMVAHARGFVERYFTAAAAGPS